MSEVQKETCNDYLEREYTQASGNGGQPTRLMIQSILYGNIQQFIRERQCTSDALRIYKEQNWNGKGNLPPKRRVDNYFGCAGFWVPNVGKNPVQKAKSAVKKVAAKAPAKRTKWNWKGRFYPNAKNGIRVRRAPSTSAGIVDKGSWLYTKNDWVDFDQIIKANGYWFIRFKYPTNPKAGYFYCAVCKITDPKERIKREKNFWGSIKWKQCIKTFLFTNIKYDVNM